MFLMECGQDGKDDKRLRMNSFAILNRCKWCSVPEDSSIHDSAMPSQQSHRPAMRKRD